MRLRALQGLVVGLCVLAGALSVHGATIVLSTEDSATLGGVTFRDGDLVAYNQETGTATLFFSEDNFSNDEDVDAVGVLGNGHLILSTRGGATLGGLTFEDGDLAEYDRDTDTATLFFDEDNFSGDEDVDAVAVLGNGHIVLSTTSQATVGGLTLSDGDLAEYDPGTGTAALLFDEDWFESGEDIDAIDVLSNGHLIISTVEGATLGGLTFRDGDLAEYDPETNTATLFFNEDLFGGSASQYGGGLSGWGAGCYDNEDVDAVLVIVHDEPEVPEPGTLVILASGVLALVGGLKKRG